MSYIRQQQYSQSEPYSRSTSSTPSNAINQVPSPTATSPFYESPITSTSMIRKRTLQEMTAIRPQSIPTTTYTFDSTSSSPMSSLPSFEFDHLNNSGNTSSPFTNQSSPMTLCHSNSSISSIGSHHQLQQQQLQQSQRIIKSNSDEESNLTNRAPEMKRRKTIDVTLLTPTKSDRRGNGKDGQDVWPTEVENSFHAALEIIPKLGRKKVMVNGKPCGRNELIADYIRRKTGKIRSRKQVSSHIQVLKNMRKHDAVFMALVAEPAEGEDCFAPEAAILFFGRNLPSLGPHAGAPMMASYSDAGLLSPYTPSAFPTQQRSLSCGSISPTSSFDRSNLNSPTAISHPMSATSSLTTAMKELHFPIPNPLNQSRSSTTTPCPIAPAAFRIWSEQIGSSHTFAKLDTESLAGPSRKLFLEDLPMSDVRFPGLVDMNEHLPCQFLHVKINLDIPSEDIASGQLKTQLILTSIQNLNLTSITSIYSYGTQVLSLEEKLPSPNRLNSSTSISSTESSPDSPCSPLTPTDSFNTNNPLRHKYSYSSPFASDFWSIFLSGAFSAESESGSEQDQRSGVEPSNRLPTFSKTGAERSEFAMAISGLSVIQEFVVRPEESSTSTPLVAGTDISPGSALGDVVLVITYDFECLESSTAGLASLSHLSIRKRNAIPQVTRMQPSFLSTNRSTPIHSFPTNYSVGASSAVHSSSPATTILSPRPTHISKPSLTLHIPPPSSFLSSSTSSYNHSAPTSSSTGPITPWPQVMHTPNLPPPIINSSNASPTQRDRLEQIWARTTNEWESNSPALMGAFSLQQDNHNHHQHHQQSNSNHGSSNSTSPNLGSSEISRAMSYNNSNSTSPSSSSSHQYHHQQSNNVPYIHPAHGLNGMLTYIKSEESVEAEAELLLLSNRSRFSVLDGTCDLIESHDQSRRGSINQQQPYQQQQYHQDRMVVNQQQPQQGLDYFTPSSGNIRYTSSQYT